MNPDEITLDTPSKAFAFEKTARDLDKIKDLEVLRNVAKTYVKLYMKQQEVLKKL